MEIKSLTGLRGVAALIVLWFHIKEALISRGLELHIPLLVERLLLSGGHSVDIFFVLSGFILALTYQNWFSTTVTSDSYLKYLRRRFARIYPLHFVLLLATALAVVVAQALNLKTTLGLDRFDFATLPEHLLLVQAWGVFSNDIGNWNPPTWSISIEVLAYLMLPPILLWLARFRPAGSSYLLAVAILLGFGLNFLTPWGDYGFAGIARGISEFFLGCITARFLKASPTPFLQTGLGSSLSIAALILVCATITDTGFAVGLSAAPLILALCGNNPVSRFFALRPIYFLGEISYSVYIGHFLYTLVAWRIVNPDWMATGPVPLAIGFVITNILVIALSTITYYLIECPGRNFLSDKKRLQQQPST